MKRVVRALARRLGATPAESGSGASVRRRKAGVRAAGPRAAALRALERGAPLDEALVRQVRALLRTDDVAGAQALADSLLAHAETAEVGRLLAGIVAHHRGFTHLAWERLGSLPRRTVAEHAAGEFIRSGLLVDPERTCREVEALVDEPPALPRGVWFDLLGPLLAVERVDLARRVVAVIEESLPSREGAADGARARLEGLRPWLAADPAAAVLPPRKGTTFAVLDYMRPGASVGSKNIGDHVQSISALAHLVRHQGVRLSGEPELRSLLTDLQSRTRSDLRLHDADADVEVITVQRDASTYQQVPDGTWALCFGWYMHSIAGVRYCFPLNSALRPIFVSFHCNRREMLSDAAVEYMKKYGPVGCRDWTTVYMLLSMGVPAFFSGCLTTTISTLFPEPGPSAAERSGVAYVDAYGEVPARADRYEHVYLEVRGRSFVENCRAALERLTTYRRYERVVTSRLHCYLPMRSLGATVDFEPRNLSDTRFDGLGGISDQELDAMRVALLDKMDTVFSAILGGASEGEVYARWREITAPDVAAARDHARRDTELPAPSSALAPAIEHSVSRTLTRPAAEGEPPDGVVHCAVVVGPGDDTRLPALVRSLDAHTSRPVHLWLLTLRPRPALLEELTGLVPGLSVSSVPVERLAETLFQRKRSGPWAFARVAMPDLLPGVDRVALLPAGSIVVGDLAELAGLDLDGSTVAVPTLVGRSGFAVLHRAAERLRERTDLSHELLRTAYSRHAFDFDAFGTDVMVLDLKQMRSEGFTAQAAGVALAYGMDERETLHYLFGAGRAVLPPTWDHVPPRSAEAEPRLVHWTGEVRPWDDLFVAGQGLWQQYARS